MSYIALELVRDKDGNVKNIVALDPNNIVLARNEHGLPTGGYVQVMNGQVVCEFGANEILIAQVSGAWNF